MADNKSVAIFGSQTANESLSEEKASRLGVGKLWNIVHLLNELDYLHIQEKQVREPLDDAFITKALWLYYLQRGASSGIACALVFILFRAMHIGLSFVTPVAFNNALLYIITAVYVYYLSTILTKMITYHHGAATKAVTLVFEAGIGGVVLAGVAKSSALFMLIFYRSQITTTIYNWNAEVAWYVDWTYIHILGYGYVELCFSASVIIGGAAAFAMFNLRKSDLKADRALGRPYNRLSVDA